MSEEDICEACGEEECNEDCMCDGCLLQRADAWNDLRMDTYD